MPALPTDITAAAWRTTMDDAFHAFCERVEAEAQTVIDPYGTQSIDEFFGVACEAFFVQPGRTKGEHPALYAMLARYFRQDPAADTPPPRARA